MPKRVAARKFMSPPLKGDPVKEVSDNEGNISGTSEEMANVNRSLSASQYEDLFSSVLRHTEKDSDRKLPNTHANVNNEEDEVAVPEPNVALSPPESAEEGPNEFPENAEGNTMKTPDKRIDNSVLPPIKRKKPVSKIAQLKLKLKPTKLNFDHPALLGEPDHVPKPKKSKSLSSKTSQKPKTTSKPSESSDLKRPNKPDSKKKNCPRTDLRGSRQDEFRTPSRKVLDDSQLSVGSIGHEGVNLQTPNSSQLLCSQSSSVQMQILSPRSRLFRLQRKRNVGLWVQCTNRMCTKWRYLPSTRDPTEVPDNWQCYMNYDKKYASCSAPEKGPTPVEEEDLIHNQYTAGSVVWGHLAGYPWWPAMVDDDPDVEQYYWITETCDIPTHYNVTFFDDKPVTRAWLAPGAITKYSQPAKDVSKMLAYGKNYSRRIEVAKCQAEEALKLSVDERLKKFSFVARYKGPIGKKRYPSDSEDDEVVEKAVRRAEKVPRKDNTALEEDPMVGFAESLEILKEVNEVLNELSESESKNGEESAKGPSSAKKSGMGKNKKGGAFHAKSIPDAKHEDDKRKETKQKKKKVKEGEEKSMAKQDDQVGEKDKQSIINNVVHKDNLENNKETSRDKKNKEKKHKGENGEIKKDKPNNEELKQNQVINRGVGVTTKHNLDQNENDKKKVKHTRVHPKESLKKRGSDNKQETDKDDGKPSSDHISKEDKAVKKTHGAVQKERNKSEKKIVDSHSNVSSADYHHNSEERIQSEKIEECTSMERSDNFISSEISNVGETTEEEESTDEEKSTDVDDSECETIAGNKGDGKTSSEEEMNEDNYIAANSRDDESKLDESCAQSPLVLSASSGRSSADMFEPHQCSAGQVSPSSQHSADFDIEE